MALSDVHWKGMKALTVMADVLPTRIAKAKITEAYEYALEPTKGQMKANIPNDKTGKLKHSIDITVKGTQISQQAFAIVGPRRKKNTWDMSGWGAHLLEAGTKPHVIKPTGVFKGRPMPIYSTKGFTGHFAKEMYHSGSPSYKPFSKAIDATWASVASRVSDKASEIMRNEIKAIWLQYGQVVTSAGAVLK